MGSCTYPMAPQERDISNTALVVNSEKCFNMPPLCLAGVFPSICKQVKPSFARADAARSNVDFQNENTMLSTGKPMLLDDEIYYTDLFVACL